MDMEKYVNKIIIIARMPDKPRLDKNHTTKEVEQYARELNTYDVIVKERHDEVQSQRKETKRLEALFKTDALEELGLTNHPKSDKLFDIAWNKCHSSGLQQVWDEMEELSELLT